MLALLPFAAVAATKAAKEPFALMVDASRVADVPVGTPTVTLLLATLTEIEPTGAVGVMSGDGALNAVFSTTPSKLTVVASS